MKSIVRQRVTLLITLCLFSAFAFGQGKSASNCPIIPMPYTYSDFGGQIYLDKNTEVTANTADAQKIASLLTSYIDAHASQEMAKPKTPAKVVLEINPIGNIVIGDEGYVLEAKKNTIKIKANTATGLFYGYQSLLQLLPPDAAKPLTLNECLVVDKSEFKWRGIMLDVARHMLPLDYIKKYIDIMAFYKLNMLHLHLTDDQGWRIEIKKYPKLAEIAAYREKTLTGWQGNYPTEADFKFDNTPYGGYYTQEQLRELVKYAAERHITIMPEIEMPGHSVAVLSAYPELACSGSGFKAATYWGVFEDIVCPTPETIKFFESILDEVCDIFPSAYIHIGGDEAPKARWKESSFVQELMKREGITDVEKVQGWFNRQIENYLKQKGRKLMGWDEILDGGISQQSAVMSWRGEEGGIAAANAGNYVVMTPGSKGLYWDYAYGNIKYEPENTGRREGNASLRKIYSYYPIPDQVDLVNERFILGVQANLWSEYITNTKAHEYLSFPRILALSEIGWTNRDKKNWAGFLERTTTHYDRFKNWGVNYRVPEAEMASSTADKNGKVNVRLFSPVPKSKIFYTIDGTEPTNFSKTYFAPFEVETGNNPVTIKAITYFENGSTSIPSEFTLPKYVKSEKEKPVEQPATKPSKKEKKEKQKN